MTDEQAAKPKKKLSSRILRDRLGSAPKQPLQLSSKHIKLQKRLKQVLADGPKTVPDIAETTGLPTRQVFWHLMSLKKYGEIIEGEERDSYVEYALKAKEESKP
jgi:predicted Rossmann fold nucleotide-binding protein DprA/Smf involved in DNA uptake